MGVDVYMSWNKMTKEEKDARITGYDISKGYVGYLRASYGMPEECKILSQIFPAKFWEDKNPLPYNFKANVKRVFKLLREYVANAMTHKGDDITVIIWASSVIQFFWLGIEKQEAKLIPKIYISH